MTGPLAWAAGTRASLTTASFNKLQTKLYLADEAFTTEGLSTGADGRAEVRPPAFSHQQREGTPAFTARRMGSPGEEAWSPHHGRACCPWRWPWPPSHAGSVMVLTRSGQPGLCSPSGVSSLLSSPLRLVPKPFLGRVGYVSPGLA